MIPAMDTRSDRDRTPTGIRLDNDRTTVTIAEAARVLGLSTDAVRKRLQRGTIAGEKIGDTWRVFLEDESTTGPSPVVSSHRPDDDRTTAAAVDPLVETLREEVVYLREQLAERSRELAAERERFDVLHREALARIPALGAGQDAPQASSAVHHTPGDVEPVVDDRPLRGPSAPIGPPAWRTTERAEAERVPWWRRWWERWQ